MSRQLEKTIKTLMDDIQQREAELLEDRRTVNSLCRRLGRPPPFPALDPQPEPAPLARVVRADQFANEPSTESAAHAFLAWSGPAAGPQSFKTIFDMLTYGGFRFGGGSLEKRQEKLRAALATAPFVRSLGDDWYSLVERAREAGPRSRARLRAGRAARR